MTNDESDLPRVSVLVPCRNEARYIVDCVESIFRQDYPKNKFEVLIADGMSTDGTQDLLLGLSRKHVLLKVFQNEQRTVPHAMNKMIRNAVGDVIVRMDAHAFFPTDYVSKLVKWMFALHADNVGGVWITKPLDNSAKARAIADVLAHPLGVGNSLFRIGVKQPTEVDTVPFGCYRRETLMNIGLYDERLTRNQDIELNKRLKANGGKIYLVPDVYSIYYARGTFAKLMSNNYANGLWVILASYYTRTLSSLSLRHFVPLCFLLYVLTMPLWFLFWWTVLPMCLYALMVTGAAAQIGIKEKSLSAGVLAAVAFPLLHLSYGCGSVVGLFRLMSLKRAG